MLPRPTTDFFKKSFCFRVAQDWNTLPSDIRMINWGEPERAPHYRGLRDHVHRPTDRPTDQPTDRPTDRPCPSHSRDTDTLHVPTLPSRLATHVRHVNSAVRSRDSYKTENADDGKAKSRDTRATHCEAGTSERPANLFILALPCRCRHASLDFTYVSFSRRLLQTNPFSHFPT